MTGWEWQPLMRDGYVETVADKGDRRIPRVRLTRSGEKKLAGAMMLWKVAQQRLEDRIGADKAEKLRAALDEIARIDLGMRSRHDRRSNDSCHFGTVVAGVPPQPYAPPAFSGLHSGKSSPIRPA